MLYPRAEADADGCMGFTCPPPFPPRCCCCCCCCWLDALADEDFSDVIRDDIDGKDTEDDGKGS